MQKQRLSPPGRRTASHPVHLFFAVAAFLGAGLVAPACGDNSNTSGSAGASGTAGSAGTGSGDCIDGVIVNGVCQGKCKPELCGFENNTCVGNSCVLKCTSHADCYPDGSQSCVPAKEDDTGADIMVCQFTGEPAGQGTACPFGSECENWLACPDGGTCFASQCGGMPQACVKDDAACGKNADCVVGKCPDGSGCRVDCAASCKPWLECQGVAEGDADAYCTKRDCATDDDCLDGYYCGILRDPHEVCGSNPSKGNNKLCGKTLEPCIAVGADGKATDGTSRFEGSVCMLRRSCLKRDTAAPCKTDLDCSLVPGQMCVSFAGESRCAHKCASNLDCEKDAMCNSAVGGACTPKFGAWVGAGGGFCEPCLTDEDCGSKGTSWACVSLSGNMRACFDESFPDMCMFDADCPKSPSGKHGTCFNDNVTDPSDQLYDHCYLPINLATDNKTTCW